MYLNRKLTKLCQGHIDMLKTELSLEEYLQEKLYVYTNIRPKAVEISIANSTVSADIDITIEYKPSYHALPEKVQQKILGSVREIFTAIVTDSNFYNVKIEPSFKQLKVEIKYFKED